MPVIQSHKTSHKLEYIYYFIKYVNRRMVWAVLKKKLKVSYGKKEMSEEEGNEELSLLIKSKNPFVVGKFGCTEIGVISEVIKNELNLGKIRQGDRRSLIILSGFFPNEEESIKQFALMYLDMVGCIDILGTWNNRFEDYIVKKYMKTTRLSDLHFLEPYYFEKPWSRFLKGKKVLVVHPFAESINSQYQKREFLFENEDILPEFQLITLKAVQTVAGNKSEFETWFDALNYMYEKAISIDFDVALVGCGAYGLPLAIKLRQAGKQAIHTGGATQILFGIKGGRWDQNPKISKMYNKYWIRPNLNETPKGVGNVEEACYW